MAQHVPEVVDGGAAAASAASMSYTAGKRLVVDLDRSRARRAPARASPPPRARRVRPRSARRSPASTGWSEISRPKVFLRRYVVGQQHGDDTGGPSGGRDVDRADAGRRVRAAQRRPEEHPVRLQVAAVERSCPSPSARRRYGARSRLTSPWVHDDLPRSGQPHGFEDLLVAGTAAEVAGERLADRLVVRIGSRSSKSTAATTMPGVQKPHWTAPVSRNASWTGWSRPGRAKATRRCARSVHRACSAGTRHEQTSSPSSQTEHEPHSPCSHAAFCAAELELVRASTSRRLVSGGTSSARATPFTVVEITHRLLLERAPQEPRRESCSTAWRR